MATAVLGSADFKVFDVQGFQPRMGAIRSRIRPKLLLVRLSGGGVRNGFLWHLLEQQFTPRPLAKTDQFGISIEARKSMASGMLAALMMDGVPASLPSATGAPGARLLGSITPGSPANWARCLAWMAAQTPPPTEMSDEE